MPRQFPLRNADKPCPFNFIGARNVFGFNQINAGGAGARLIRVKRGRRAYGNGDPLAAKLGMGSAQSRVIYREQCANVFPGTQKWRGRSIKLGPFVPPAFVLRFALPMGSQSPLARPATASTDRVGESRFSAYLRVNCPWCFVTGFRSRGSLSKSIIFPPFLAFSTEFNLLGKYILQAEFKICGFSSHFA